MKGVQCYELFGRVALKNDAFFLLFAVKGMFIKKVNVIGESLSILLLVFPFSFSIHVHVLYMMMTCK